MKSVFLMIFTFLSFVFVGHMIFGNTMPSLDELVLRIENSSVDFSGLIDGYDRLLDMYEEVEEFRLWHFEYVNFFPKENTFLAYLEHLWYVVENSFIVLFGYLKVMGYAIYLIGYAILLIVLDFLFILTGIFSVLFGIGV